MTRGFRPELPIHIISEEGFGKFKDKHLDGDILKEEDLDEIKKLFGLDDRTPDAKAGMLSCDEYHAHSYRCNYYFSPEAGIVDRLLNELANYQRRIEKIRAT